MKFFEAQQIISALAMGADPETGEVLHVESVFNKPDVVRALFLASRLLEKEAAREARKKELPQQAGRAWSSAEELQLIEAFEQGVDVEDIAANHGRTPVAIAARLVRLGKIQDRSDIYIRPPRQLIHKPSNE